MVLATHQNHLLNDSRDLLFYFFNFLLAALAGSRLSLVAASRSYSLVVMRGLTVLLSSLCRRAQALGLAAFRVCSPWGLESRLSSRGTRA